MKRWPYDLSNFSICAGHIGRLQTLATIPIVAGDSISLNYSAVARLSGLRRNLTLDANVSLYLFYQPYRHVYTNWVDFIQAGVDEALTLAAGAAVGDYRYLGTNIKAPSGNMPLWLTACYNRIWNEYFRAPSDTAAIKTDIEVQQTATNGAYWGELCGRMKTPWSTGIDPTTDASDREVTVTASKLDILDLATVKNRYSTEQLRDFFANRYRDVLSDVWGGHANPDADERPTLVMKSSNNLSGYDVDGTADANLGSFSGKSAATVHLRAPARYYPEHGTLMLMALVRFPTVFNREKHYLMDNNDNPSYTEIAGDPDIVAVQAPMVVSADDWFAGGASNDLGTIPYGQWYRHHPNYVHEIFQGIQGFPFTAAIPTTATEARYHTNGEYTQAFETEQLGQWNTTGHLAIRAKRTVPPASSSIFAGTR